MYLLIFIWFLLFGELGLWVWDEFLFNIVMIVVISWFVFWNFLVVRSFFNIELGLLIIFMRIEFMELFLGLKFFIYKIIRWVLVVWKNSLSWCGEIKLNKKVFFLKVFFLNGYILEFYLC